MKSMKMFWVVFLFLFAVTANASAAEKIGYVDLSRLFDEYHKTKEFDAELEKKHSSYEKERNEKIEKIREAQGKLALLAEDKRQDLEEEIEGYKQDLLEFDRQQKTDLTKERNDVIRDILLEIEKKVSSYAEKNKFSIILNDRVLIYGSPSMEITEEVLESLNANK